MKFEQCFHTILLFAQKSGLSFIDPFGNFKFNFDKTDRGCLTQEKIDTTYCKEFTYINKGVENKFLFIFLREYFYKKYFDNIFDKLIK